MFLFKGLYRVQYLDHDVDDLSPIEALRCVMTYNDLFQKENVDIYGSGLDEKFPLHQYPNPRSFKKADIEKEHLEYKSHFEDDEDDEDESIEFDDEGVVDEDLVLTPLGFISRDNFADDMEALDVHPSYNEPSKSPKVESTKKSKREPRKTSTPTKYGKWMEQSDDDQEDSESESLSSYIFRSEIKYVDFERISKSKATNILKGFIDNLLNNRDSEDYNLYLHDLPLKNNRKSLTKEGKYYRGQIRISGKENYLGLYDTAFESYLAERIFKIKKALIGDTMPLESAAEESKEFATMLMADYMREMNSDERKVARRDDDEIKASGKDRKRKVAVDSFLDEDTPKIARSESMTQIKKEKEEPEDYVINYQDGYHYLKVWHKGEVRFTGSFDTLEEAYHSKERFFNLLHNRNYDIRANDEWKESKPCPSISKL